MRRVLILSGLAVLLAACATVDGIGQDLSGAARTVRDVF